MGRRGRIGGTPRAGGSRPRAARTLAALALLAAAGYCAYDLPPGGGDTVANLLHIAGAAVGLAGATLLVWL